MIKGSRWCGNLSFSCLIVLLLLPHYILFPLSWKKYRGRCPACLPVCPRCSVLSHITRWLWRPCFVLFFWCFLHVRAQVIWGFVSERDDPFSNPSCLLQCSRIQGVTAKVLCLPPRVHLHWGGPLPAPVYSALSSKSHLNKRTRHLIAKQDLQRMSAPVTCYVSGPIRMEKCSLASWQTNKRSV